ncbi:hypothetical protein GCM10009678_55190 [Actinomadura kijaniata]|uniref:Secreted protein n=1 Tax=Actinomadura namibiensis TaxID=182080 RepID=A0A7W3LLC0_ACTNM|nr:MULTISPECIES: hypothetical protein [Actinomadura]MBA8950266.1 hypothetical protein [Actinomadura namibiensis]
MKGLARTGLLALVVGGALMSATPAMAHGDDNDEYQSNSQILGVQTCRDVNVGVIAVVIDNILATNKEHGHCANGSAIDD